MIAWSPDRQTRAFLSTLSLRRATDSTSSTSSTSGDFYPRSPCGERRGRRPEKHHQWHISIHALLAESDFYFRPGNGQNKTFLSTLSLRRATGSARPRFTSCKVFLSTLSLRRATGSTIYDLDEKEISIHALLAESDGITDQIVHRYPDFYPRSPCGERPAQKRYHGSATTDFYPRSPCGERLSSPNTSIIILDISIHALLAESD